MRFGGGAAAAARRVLFGLRNWIDGTCNTAEVPPLQQDRQVGIIPHTSAAVGFWEGAAAAAAAARQVTLYVQLE
jgi:hypothetical protein